MYKLLIVDDEPLVQVGIKSMLNWSQLDIEICGLAMNGKAALEIIEEEAPDIVITDIKMPIMSGLELVRICRERYGNKYPAFIILTSYEDFHMAKEALKYQVTDYLVKLELTAETLKTAVDRILDQKRLEEEEHRSSSKPSQGAGMQSLYDKFFIRLLHNLFDSKEQFLIQSRDLKLHFEADNYVCCYSEITGHLPEGLPIEKQLNLYSSTLQMLKEIIVKYVPAYVISLDLKHFAILFFLSGQADIPEFIAGVLKNVGDTLHKYYNVVLRTGIGSAAADVFGISDSYQYARQAFSYTTEECRTLHIDDCTNAAPSNLFNISVFKDSLTRAYEEYDSDVLYDTLKQITDLFSANPTHFVQAMDGACNILYLTLSMLSDGEALVSQIFDKYPDNYRSLYKQSTMEQLVDWLDYFRDSLCSIFQERKKDHKNHIVTGVKRYITGHIRERLTLNEVAAEFEISPNYLSQLFKKFNDMGFNEYVTYLKIQEAKSMLAESTMKIYEVADMLGFESAFYFSKVFKKVEGISPTEYQNMKII